MAYQITDIQPCIVPAILIVDVSYAPTVDYVVDYGRELTGWITLDYTDNMEIPDAETVWHNHCKPYRQNTW